MLGDLGKVTGFFLIKTMAGMHFLLCILLGGAYAYVCSCLGLWKKFCDIFESLKQCQRPASSWLRDYEKVFCYLQPKYTGED